MNLLAFFILLIILVGIIRYFVYLHLRQDAIFNKKMATLNYGNEFLANFFPDHDFTMWLSHDGAVSFDQEFADNYGIPTTSLKLHEFYLMVHPDSRPLLSRLKDFPTYPGRQSFRLKLTYDGGKTWRWAHMAYNVTQEAIDKQALYGVLRDITHEVEIEEQLQREGDEIKQKSMQKGFLEKMDADLHVPLEAIRALILGMTDAKTIMPKAQREECNKDIQKHTAEILELLNQALLHTKNKAGDITGILLCLFFFTSCSHLNSELKPFDLQSWAIIYFVMILGGLATGQLTVYIRKRVHRMMFLRSSRTNSRRINALESAECGLINDMSHILDHLDVIHPSCADVADKIKTAILHENQLHSFIFYGHRLGSKKYEWFQLKFITHVSADGVKRFNAIISSVNNTKSREEELKQEIERAKDMKKKADFLMTMSHEIRTPLNAIQGFCDIVADMPDEVLDEATINEFAGYIRNGFVQVQYMLEGIYYLSHFEAGNQSYDVEVFDAVPFLDERVERWQNYLPEGLTLEHIWARNHAFVKADQAKVRYIINGLLSNAMKFTTAGTIKVISLERFSTREIMLMVSDTGCGIAEENFHTVFEMFAKIDSYTSGLGIGLGVAQHLAQDMGGYLVVDSKPNVGTTIILNLPMATNEEINAYCIEHGLI